ncbi:MAG TPA: GNAT family N-acetyltransferase [Candidatus Tectomicrobia bacterium]|jgi:RimJ/RimL family protein N-acetyltransferase
MPVLETPRLQIRPFSLNDLDAIHQLLDVELRDVELGDTGARTRQAREQWLQWTIVSYEQLAALNQPPYGDRAVVLKPMGPLIGVCGFVPCLEAFGQLPSFATDPATPRAHLTSTEFGLYYAFFPAYQRQGYATEAVRALAAFAFNVLQLQRIVATTTYENVRSIGLMRRLGMRIEQNPSADLTWPQVVGVLENPMARVLDRP